MTSRDLSQQDDLLLDALANAAEEWDDWPFTISVGPVHDTGTAQDGAAWRWWVKDAEGAGITGTAATQQEAEAERLAEIDGWWEQNAA